MWLHNLADDILFDELEETSQPNKKFFISSLYVIESLLKPKKLDGKIYTSKNIMVQMLNYYVNNGAKLSKENFVILQPNVTQKLHYEDRECIEVIMFETEDINRNVMFMFRKANKTTHVYAGVCTELRSLMFNTVFRDWIRDGVAKLYVDVSRATRSDKDPRELQNALDDIEKLYDNMETMLILNIPKLGYETLVYHLSERLRARVFISGTMFSVFQYLNKNQYCVSDSQDAKIIISHKILTIADIKRSHQKRKYVFLKITDKNSDANKDFGFYEIDWSPLPSAFVLRVLAYMVHPDRIYSIHHNNYGTQMAPEVPDYLLKLCVHYPKIVDEAENLNISEMGAIDDAMSSTVKYCTDADAELSTNIADVNQSEKRKRKVQEWLFGNQAECGETESSQNPKRLITEEQQNTLTTNCNKNTNRSSSVTKSLKQAHHKAEIQQSTNANVFCIQKGSLKYLEDSDSD